MTRLRRVLARGIAAIGSVVYDLGVQLFRLSDWVEGPVDEPAPVQIHVWDGDQTSTTGTITTTFAAVPGDGYRGPPRI